MIGANHEHIDLVYLAAPDGPYDGTLVGDESLGWFDRAALAKLPLDEEIVAWTDLALREVSTDAGG